MSVLDFIKLHVSNQETIDRLLSDNRLTLFKNEERAIRHRKVESNIQLFQYTTVLKWCGVHFCFNIGGLDILLKPHYLYNDGKHNANDFHVGTCIEVLRSFVRGFKLSPNELRVMSLEYGFLFLSPIPFQDLISSLAYHERNEFLSSNDGLRWSRVSGGSKSRGKVGDYKRIKIYSKGSQQPVYADENLIRFEIHSKRTQFLESKGVYTLKDLLEASTYETLRTSLKHEFSQVLFLDHYNPMRNLSKAQIIKVKDFNNQQHWYKASQAHRNTFNNNKNSYFKLLDQTGENIHRKLELIVENKLEALTKPCAILTP